MIRVVAIIQARLGSTRLPRKVLSPIGGATMLEHVVRRASKATCVDDVVVATTVCDQDDAIVALCRDRDWSVTRGSEDDVLARFHAAAVAHEADIVVRICSDCPLVDPELIDAVVAPMLQDPEIDYTANNTPRRTYPIGLDLEAIRFRALDLAHREDTDPARREHVTPFIREYADRFRIVTMGLNEDRSDHRWTVDVPADMELMTRVFEASGGSPGGWREVLELLASNPDWSRLNAHVPQKALTIESSR